MIKMLIGLAFVGLELTLTTETMSISLLPDFVGYILLLMGQRELAHENDYFYKNIKFCLWAGTVSLMVFIMDLIYGSLTVNFQVLLLQMLLLVMEPICLFRIVRGVRQVGKDYDIDVKGKLLFIVWLVMTLLNVASFFISGIPQLGNALGLLLSICTFAFIALFFNFKIVYDEIRPEPEEEEEEASY